MALFYAPGRLGSQATGWACRPEGTNICTCVGSAVTGFNCGNGAISGSGFGAGGPTVVQNVTTANVLSQYGPDRIGAAATGWSCVPSRIDNGNDMTYTCECLDSSCDNGSPSGFHHQTITGITPLSVDGLYGAHRFSTQNTGWGCTPSGVNIVACEATSCGNDGFPGLIGDVFSLVTTSQALEVPFGYGVLLRGAEDTGWNTYCSSY